MKKNVESQAAKTILQEPEEITIGGKTYTVAPPSVATIILASEVVSRLPRLYLDENKVVEETLSIAKDCRGLGDLTAILILGAKEVKKKIKRRQEQPKRALWGLIRYSHEETIYETARDILSRELLENASPRELHNAVAQIISKIQIADFFGLTTFLTGINMMRPTKVETDQTASGQ